MHGSTAPGWRLSLVIPAYNEESGIADAVAEADEALARHAADYEILVVNDGSRDQTAAVAERAARERPHVRVLHHDTNRGYGAALRTGFEAARFDRVAFTDADCQFDLNDLGRLVPLADEVPIVAGYRVDRKDPWRRKFLSRGYNLLARTLLGTRVRDCDCALKVYRRDTLSHLLPESRNFFVNTEMLTRARQQNVPLAELGVAHRPRRHGQSKVSLTDVPKTLTTLLPFWWSRVMFPGAMTPAAYGPALLPFLLVMLVAGVLFFSRLGTPLLEPEEARYAEIPRQMLADGNWLVPTLHGQPYLDKPPLFYWLVMASYSIFGVHDWAARLVPGLAGLLTVALAFFWAHHTVGVRAALLGAIVLCLSAKFIYLGRMLTMNGLLALFVTAGLAFGHLALLEPRRRLGYLLAAGLACGLGLLAKGPVGMVLVVPPLLVISLLDRRLARPSIAGIAILWATALLTAAPWYAAILIRRPEFAEYFFWFHNVKRFVQPFDHEGPVWQYLPGLLVGIMPWTLLVIPAARFLTQRLQRKADRRPAALGLFLLSFGWMFLFFSLAGSKRPVYLVPVFPPLALAVGCILDGVLPRTHLAHAWRALWSYRDRLAYAMTAAALALGLAGGVTMLVLGAHKPERALYVAGISGLLLLAFLARHRERKAPWALAGVAMFAVLLGGIHELLPEYARRFSLRHPVRMELSRPEVQRAAIFCYPHRWESVTYYAARTDVRAFSRLQREEMIDALGARRHSVVLVQTKYLPEVLRDLPHDLDFITRQDDGGVTIGEVRRREEAPPAIARR